MGNSFVAMGTEVAGAVLEKAVGDAVGAGPIGTAAGAVATVVFQRSVPSFQNHPYEDVEDKVGRLQSLAERIRLLTSSVVDRDDLKDGRLLRWYDRLIREAEKGEQVVNTVKSQQTDCGSSSTAGSFGFKSGLKRLRDGVRSLFSSEDQRKLLDSALARIEKEYADIGVFGTEVEKIIFQPNKRRRLRRCTAVDVSAVLHFYRNIMDMRNEITPIVIQVSAFGTSSDGNNSDQHPLLVLVMAGASQISETMEKCRGWSADWSKKLEQPMPAAACSWCQADEQEDCCLYRTLSDHRNEVVQLMNNLLWYIDERTATNAFTEALMIKKTAGGARVAAVGEPSSSSQASTGLGESMDIIRSGFADIGKSLQTWRLSFVTSSPKVNCQLPPAIAESLARGPRRKLNSLSPSSERVVGLQSYFSRLQLKENANPPAATQDVVLVRDPAKGKAPAVDSNECGVTSGGPLQIRIRDDARASSADQFIRRSTRIRKKVQKMNI